MPGWRSVAYWLVCSSAFCKLPYFFTIKFTYILTLIQSVHTQKFLQVDALAGIVTAVGLSCISMSSVFRMGYRQQQIQTCRHFSYICNTALQRICPHSILLPEVDSKCDFVVWVLQRCISFRGWVRCEVDMNDKFGVIGINLSVLR